MRRDSAGVVAGEELDVGIDERTTRLPDAKDLEDPGWDDEGELTEAWDFESLAPWHAPESEQAPDWALELTTSYDKPALPEPEFEWDEDAALTRRFDPEPETTSTALELPRSAARPRQPARKSSATESGTHPALRSPAAYGGNAPAAESGAYSPSTVGPRERRVGAETLPARGRDAAGRAKVRAAVRNPLEPARWPLSAALSAPATDEDAPRLLQAVPPSGKGARRVSGVIAAPHAARAERPTRRTEKVWPAPPSAPSDGRATVSRHTAARVHEAAAPASSSRPTLRPPASPEAHAAAAAYEAASRPTWRPSPSDGEAAAYEAASRPTWRPSPSDGETAAYEAASRPTRRPPQWEGEAAAYEASSSPTWRPPAVPEAEAPPASARTTSRRPALRQSDASAALAAASRLPPRRPTLRERVSARAAEHAQLEPAAVTTSLRRAPESQTWAAAQLPASPRVFESLAPVERPRLPPVRHLPPGLLWGAAGAVFVALCVTIRVVAGGSTELVPEPTAVAAPVVAVSLEETGFTLVSRPAGAQVFVDGKSTGLITPARVRPLSPGLHAVELKLAGYYDTGLPAVLEPGLTVALGDVELRPLPAPQTAAAELAPSPRWRAASSEKRSWSARRARTASSLSAADLAAVSDAKGAPMSGAPLAAKSGGSGTLQLNSRPWARILVDGEFVGNTPQLRLPLSAGTHSVRLVNETLRMSKTFSVVIRAGETVTRVETLTEDPAQSRVVAHGRNVLAKLGR